jgi:Integrase core domain
MGHFSAGAYTPGRCVRYTSVLTGGGDPVLNVPSNRAHEPGDGMLGSRSQSPVSFHSTRKPTQNAFVESFNGRFPDECLNEHSQTLRTRVPSSNRGDSTTTHSSSQSPTKSNPEEFARRLQNLLPLHPISGLTHGFRSKAFEIPKRPRHSGLHKQCDRVVGVFVESVSKMPGCQGS